MLGNALTIGKRPSNWCTSDYQPITAGGRMIQCNVPSALAQYQRIPITSACYLDVAASPHKRQLGRATPSCVTGAA